MADRVMVTCPECRAQFYALVSRLGLERPCPKCEVPFILDEEENRSSYDLQVTLPGGGGLPSPQSRSKPPRPSRPQPPVFDDEDEDDDGSSAPASPPMLKRGAYSGGGTTATPDTGTATPLKRTRRNWSDEGLTPERLIRYVGILAVVVVALIIVHSIYRAIAGSIDSAEGETKAAASVRLVDNGIAGAV